MSLIIGYKPSSARTAAARHWYGVAVGRGRTTGDDPTLDTCMRGDGLDRPDYGFIVRAAQGSRANIRCTMGSKAVRGMVS